MTVRELTDRAEALALLRRHPERHLLAIGDLDDAFWPDTQVLAGHGQVIVVYRGLSDPVVLAVADPDPDSPDPDSPEPDAPEPDSHGADSPRLDSSGTYSSGTDSSGTGGPETGGIGRLAAAADLPPRFYSHLSPAAAAALRARRDVCYDVAVEDEYALMTAPGAAFRTGSFAATPLDPRVNSLTESDLPDIQALQDDVHPGGGFFEAVMLRSGPYFGLRTTSDPAAPLAAMAGCHVFSRQHRVAVLGNIATRPAYRRRGFAEAVTARLCAELAPHVDLVGLTVSTANDAAVACYLKLGFTVAAVVLGARCTRLSSREYA